MEDTRAVWRWRLADELSQDVRYAPRTFRRQPGFAVVVVPTLALGIGANTAIFSLFEAIMLRGLALHEPEQLYFVAHGARRFAPSSNYPLLRAHAPGPTCLPASLATRGHVQSGRGRWRRNDARTVRQRQLSRGSRCADGDRARFTAENDRDGAGTLVAVISDGYWTRKFGRDPQVLGQTLTIDGRVVNRGRHGRRLGGLDPTRVDITLPLAVRTLDAPGLLTDHETWLGDMPIVVRVRSGVEPSGPPLRSMPRSSSFSPSRPMSGCVSCPDGTLSARR